MTVPAISPASLKAATVARIERIDELLTILRELRAGEIGALRFWRISWRPPDGYFG